MEKSYYTDAVVSTPEMATLTKLVPTADGGFTAVPIDIEEKKRIADKAVDMAWNKIVTGFDFPFLLRSSTFASEVDKYDYELKGGNTDCRDVVSISQGTTLLTKMRLIDYERKYSGVEESSSTNIWIYIGNKGKFPLIRLKGTPSEVKTYSYWYRRSGLSVKDLPDYWSHVLVDLARGGIFPGKYYRLGIASFKEMKDDYSRRGGEVSPIVGDPTWRAKNLARNNKHGY